MGPARVVTVGTQQISLQLRVSRVTRKRSALARHPSAGSSMSLYANHGLIRALIFTRDKTWSAQPVRRRVFLLRQSADLLVNRHDRGEVSHTITMGNAGTRCFDFRANFKRISRFGAALGALRSPAACIGPPPALHDVLCGPRSTAYCTAGLLEGIPTRPTDAPLSFTNRFTVSTAMWALESLASLSPGGRLSLSDEQRSPWWRGKSLALYARQQTRRR